MTSKKYTPQEIARLILACRQNQAEAEQWEKLQEWLEECEENRRFYDSLKSRTYREAGLKEYLHYDSRQDWKQVKEKISPRKRMRILKILPYAAMITLIVGIGIIALYNKSHQSQPLLVEKQEIAPGSSRAQLILANGQRIELEAIGDTLCREIDGQTFVNDGKQLAYESGERVQMAQIHTLKIPRGGEYKVILADGTKVWLNAESELNYPDAFTRDVRKVTLSGEAYFEVVKDTARPFYVKVGDMEVKVLGTSFNISAYPGCKRQTTLVEGRVAVGLKQQHVVITPGQQVTETPEGLKISRVNVGNYVAWKERRFVYEDKLLEEVLEDLQRWYDVEVFIANDGIRDLHLTANLPKYENMEKVLEIVEYAACVKFEVKGRTVVVRLDK